VAALIAVVGIVIADGVLDVNMAKAEAELPLIGVGDSFTVQYAFTAAFLALLATGLAHVLSLTTPDPKRFFSWIVWLATAIGVALPFTIDAATESQVAVSIVNLVLGIGIYSLLLATLRRSVRVHTDDAHDVPPVYPPGPNPGYPAGPNPGYQQPGQGPGYQPPGQSQPPV
jgi:hypothetical protein